MLLPLDLTSRSGKNRPYGSIPRIDWRHPLTRGLIFYGYDTGTGLVVDLVRGLRSSPSLGTISGNTSSPFGSAINYASGNAGIFFPITSEINAIFLNGLYSMACAWYITALPSIAFTCPFGINDAAGNNASAFLWDSAGNTDMQWAIANVNPALFTANSVNTYHSLLGTNETATSQSVYFDGALKTTTALTATFATSICAPCFNMFAATAGGANGNGITGKVFYGALWNRRVSPEGAKQMFDDPYCFLIYPEDEMFAEWVGASALALNAQSLVMM